MSALNPLPAVVIGGGISGLTCAYRLGQAGIPALVLDAGSRLGGVISTVEKDGFRFDLGPQSFLSTEPLLKLIEALGLKDELVRANPRAPRYIFLHGKLVPAPLAPPSLLTTPLLGARTKWRIFTEIFGHTHPPAGDESIAAFVRRKFSQELLDRLVGPFVSGIFAGDPEKLSLRAAFPKLYEFESTYGSVLRGAMKSRPPKGTPRPGLCSFRSGMEALPKALGSRLGGLFQTATTVESVRPGKANGKPWFEVDVRYRNQRETLATNAVIVATPTNVASTILQSISNTLASAFTQIEYAPLAVIGAGYCRKDVGRSGEGFGFLVPRTEGLHLLGTVWNSSLFPGCAPEGMACFTNMAGGTTDRQLFELDVDKDGDKIAATICGEAERILGITGTTVTRVVERYTHAVPQYNLGHLETVSALNTAVSAVPGLFLAGNYFSGVSIGDCVEQANRTADAAHIYLVSIGVAGAGSVAHS